jgi:4-carboxymuconolactone decarboxylase
MSRIEPRQGPFASIVDLGTRRIYGRDLKTVRVFARHPRLMFGWGRYNRTTERAPHVPKALAELGVLRAATMVGCSFCIDISSEFARRSGLSDEQLLSLRDAHASALFDADELLVIDLATGMTTTPAQVSDELAERVIARFGVKGAMELIQLIAWENSRARQNVALGNSAEGFTEGKACALPYTAAGIDSMSITNRNLTSPASMRS